MYTVSRREEGAEEDAGQRGAEGEPSAMSDQNSTEPDSSAAHREFPCRSTTHPPLPGPTPAAAASEPETLANRQRGGWQLVRALATGGAAPRLPGRTHRHGAQGRQLEVLGPRLRILAGDVQARLHARGAESCRACATRTSWTSSSFPDGRPFVAMELLEGAASSISSSNTVGSGYRGAQAPGTSLRRPCARPTAEGVIHRDVEGTNVFVEAGNPPKVKLLDFGVAHAAGPAFPGVALTGERIGSVERHGPGAHPWPWGGRPRQASTHSEKCLLYQAPSPADCGSACEDRLGGELERLHLAAPPARAGWPPGGRWTR